MAVGPSASRGSSRSRVPSRRDWLACLEWRTGGCCPGMCSARSAGWLGRSSWATSPGARTRAWPPSSAAPPRRCCCSPWSSSRRLGPGGAVAVNLVLGVVALLAIGVSLTWLIDLLVSHSGFPLVDPLIADWFAARRTPAVASAAATVLSVLRGSFGVLAVAVVGVARYPRPRAWRTDLLGVVGTAGAFVPLLILALAADWARPHGAVSAIVPNRVTLVTASLGMLAWLLSRRAPWAVGVLVWLVAIGGMLLVAGASLYLGTGWPSELVASVLLGSLWVLVFVVAWHTRAQLTARGQAETGERSPAGQPG